MPRLSTGVLLLTALASSIVVGQQKTLTLDDIYGPGGGERFNGKAAARLSFLDEPWIDDSHYLWPGDGAAPWLKVDAATGSSEPLFTADQLETALTRAGASPDAARGQARFRPSDFNDSHSGLVLSVRGDLFHYDIASGVAARLTQSDGDEELPSISPDGRSVAFVKDNDLYVAKIDAHSVKQLTTGGTTDVLNGKLDWVYSEEIFGRGNYRAYWWSPDSSRIAFIQVDERPVPTYSLLDDLDYHPRFTNWKYPKAGDPNPIVRLGVVSASGGAVQWVDIKKYSDPLIVNAGWTPDGRSVSYEVQNRTQTWLDFNLADARTGSSTTLFRETGNPWVERWEDASADPIWLHDGSFLWLSERTGFRHLYHYKTSGELIRQITRGEWEVRSVSAIDEKSGWIYFGGTERSALSRDIYRVKLDGSSFGRLTSRAGSHRVSFNPGSTLYLDSWSDVATPPQVDLSRSDGTQVRILEPNSVPALSEFPMSNPEFVSVKTRDGVQLDALMIKPPDFDPSKRYPVYQFAYGGPHNQTVVNSWGYTEYLYNQLVAAHGAIVWICDNRTASGKGMVSVAPVYRNFGELELRDIEDCAAWLKSQPYVDADRMGIYGYSFGGYLVSYALTHPSSFSMGIAGGPVTDWRDYDTLYTERYMGLPSENPEGYRRSSPRFSASGLHGDLLLIHNTGDDNVHPQNTMQLAYELQKAGKLFQMMLYPTAGHSVSEPELRRHERQTMLDFTIRTLKLNR